SAPAPSRVVRRRPQTGEVVSWLFSLHLIEKSTDFIEVFLRGLTRRESLQDKAHRRALVNFFDELADHALAGALAADPGPVHVRLGPLVALDEALVKHDRQHLHGS